MHGKDPGPETQHNHWRKEATQTDNITPWTRHNTIIRGRRQHKQIILHPGPDTTQSLGKEATQTDNITPWTRHNTIIEEEGNTNR